MKRYEPYIECYGSDFEHVALKELDSGSVVTYEDAARIIAQRDRYAELLRQVQESLSVIDEMGNDMLSRVVHGAFVMTEQRIKMALKEHAEENDK